MVNDDLIRRSDVKAACLKYSFYPTLVKNALESVPAVEAEPVVHAHWIRTDLGMKCSNPKCRRLSCLWDGDLKSRFCPWCGAHMDEEVSDVL